MEAGPQVFLASLSLYQLLGPPGWQYPAPHRELSSPVLGLGFPPLVPLAPILLSHFDYAISWSRPPRWSAASLAFPSPSLLTWSSLVWPCSRWTLPVSLPLPMCSLLIYSKHAPPPHLGSVISFLFYFFFSLTCLCFATPTTLSENLPWLFSVAGLIPRLPLLAYAFFKVAGNSTAEPHVVSSDN